jgi:phage-related protein
LVTLLGFKVDDSGREQYNKGIDQTKQKQQSLTASFLNAQVIYGVAQKALGAAFSFVRDSVIGATAETERFRVVIGSLIGDQEKANKVIHDLDYSPVSDFYGTAAAIGGLRSFVTMGMDIDKAKDQMTLLGDVAQGNSEAFNSLSANMAQVYSKGKADAMDLKQFMAQGFDVSGVLGLTEAQKKVGVTYGQVEEALKRVTAAGGPYNNMLARQMNTLGGVLKQYQSFKAATAEAIGNGINEELKEILKYILEIGRAGQKNFVGVFVKALKEVIHWIWQIIIMWEVLGFRLADMGDALAPVRGFFRSLRDVAWDVLTGIMSLVVALGKAFLALSVPISAFLTPIIQAFGRIVKKILTGIGEVIDEITPMFLEWTPIFEAIGKAIGQAFEKIMPVLDNIKDAIIAAFTPINIFLTPVVEALQPLFERVFGSIGKLFNQAEKDTNGLADIIKSLTPVFSALGNVVAFFIDIFGFLGGVIGKLIGPILGLALAVRGINTAIAIVKGTMLAVKSVIAALKAAQIGYLAVMRLSMAGNKAAAMMMNLYAIRIKAVTLAQKAQAAATKIAAVATKAWAGIQAVFNAIMAANPVALIVIGVMALIAAIVLLVKNWDKVKEGFTNAGKAIGNFFSGAGEKIKSFAGSVAEKVGGAFTALKDKVKDAAQKAVAAFAERFPNLYRFIVDLISKIKEIFGKLIDIIRPPVEAFINIIKTAFSAVIGIFKAVGISVFNVMKTVFTSIWNIIKTIFTSIWGVIKSVFDAVKNIVAAAFNVFKTIFISIFNVIKGVFFTILNTVLSVFDGIIGIWSGGGNIFSKIWESIKLIFTSAFNAILDIARIIGNAFIAVWESVKGYFIAVWEGVGGIFKNIWAGIVNIFAAYIDGIKNIIASIAGAFLNVWTQIKQGVINVVGAIIGFWQSVINAVKNIISGIVAFFKKWGEVILQVLAVVIFGIPGLIAVAVRQIIKHWDVIGPKVKAVWEKIKVFFIAIGKQIAGIFLALVQKIKQAFQWVVDRAIAIWDTLKNWFGVLVDSIKGIWLSITGWFAGLWDGIVNTAMAIWDTLKSWFADLVKGIQNIWTGITDFFSGLWEALMQGPEAAIEYIKNAFFGLFNSIQEKLFGFINKIKEGWETVKGVFGGVIGGVVNFFTGGDDSLAKDAPAKVNDMILTPDGQFETNPNDYIMAMKEPASLVRNGQEQGNSEKGSMAELVNAVASSIQTAVGMIVYAIHGIVFGTTNQYNIINNADNRAYSSNADNRADNRAYSSTSTTNAYSYDGNESNTYNTFPENGGLMGMLALLSDPLLKMADMLARFLIVQQPQAAYAGSASQAAMAGTVGQTSNYAYTTMGGSNSTVNVQTSINVNVPQGTSQEQREAIARQVDAQFDAKLAGSINSSRSNIPSPEVRRH